MAKAELPSPELLRQLLRYEPETGKLYWLPRSGPHSKGFNTRWAGKEAFTFTNALGYREGAVLQVNLLAHRVILAMVLGKWPDMGDHINGIRTDNRQVNLREVNRIQQNRNLALNNKNTSGVIGVDWSRHAKMWRVRIGVGDGDRLRHVGYFKDLGQAMAARKSAEAEHGYHENHGRVMK